MSALVQDGAVVVGAESIEKPLAARKAVTDSRAYIRRMNELGKPCRGIVLSRAAYQSLMLAVLKGRSDDMPAVCGLTIDGVPVRAFE